MSLLPFLTHNGRAGHANEQNLDPPLQDVAPVRSGVGGEQRKDSRAVPVSNPPMIQSEAVVRADAKPSPDVAAQPVSENSMLPIVAESLKRITDSASETIDSILKAAKDTREAISKTELKLNPPDLSEFELRDSKSKVAPEGEQTVTIEDTKKSGMDLEIDAELPVSKDLSKRDIQDFEASIDKAMASLMNRYVAEIKSPLKGMLFGSLVTGALIQVQKVKVMTEAAMMRMDQVLASNQLTMAGTAAMPAFMLISRGLPRCTQTLQHLTSLTW